MKKIIGKQWTCNNQCKDNCCDTIYLDVSDIQIRDLREQGHFLVKNDYTDFTWLEYHKGFEVMKHGKGKLIKVDIDYKIKHHPVTGQFYLFANSRCKQLMSNNRCKVYRTRPMACKYGRCIWDNGNPILHWFGEPIRERLKVL